ncbi:MAG: hypothetical protein LBG73_06350, partial [Spirochaetaceae bacterium]|nr:hypothetical protein [Spirochaetaceae bacterium]
MVKGGTVEFRWEVLGTEDQTVTWSLEPGIYYKSGTKIDPNTGVLTAATDETESFIKVIATSTVDKTKWGREAVAVVSSVTRVDVTPQSTRVYKGGNKQFKAEVIGPDNP